MKWIHLAKMVLPTIILTFSLCAHAQRGAPPLGSKASDPNAYYISEYDTIQMINLDYVDSNNHLVRKFDDNWVPLGDFFHDGRMAVAMNWHETIWKPGGHSFDSSWISIVRGYGKHREPPDRKPFLDSIPGRILAVGDFDGNTYKDLAVLHVIDSAVNINELLVYYFGRGGIQRVQRINTDDPYQAFAGDFNGDGYSDLLVTHGLYSRTEYLGSDSGLTLLSPKEEPMGHDMTPGGEPCIADFNGDGIDDIVTLSGPTHPSCWFAFGTRDSGLAAPKYYDLGQKVIGQGWQHTGYGHFMSDTVADYVVSKFTNYTYHHYNDFTHTIDTLSKTVGLVYIIPGGSDFENRVWVDDSGNFSARLSHAFLIPEPTLIEPDLDWTYNWWQPSIKGFGMFDSPDGDMAASDLGSLSRDSSIHVLDINTANGQFLYSCGSALDNLPDAYVEPMGNLGQAIGDWNQDGYGDFLMDGAYYDSYFTAVRYVASILPGGDYIPHTKRITGVVARPQEQNVAVQVYPNPVKSTSQAHMRISLDHSANVTLTISNLLGKTVQQIQSSEPLDEHIIPLDFHGLSEGTYFVRVRTSRGEEFYSKFNIAG